MTRFLSSAFLALAFAAALQAAGPAELTQLQQQYAFLVAERVSTPYDTGLEALNARFLSALTAAGDEAQKAGRLPELLAIQEDKKLISDKQPPPEKDDAKTPDSLKKLRAVYRAEVARLAQQRLAAHAALLPAYAAKLQALESSLTKDNRLEEAKEVLRYREGLGTVSVPVSVGREFSNSLGMKFVKVPGTAVLFCIHETRVQDYAAYAAEAPGVNDAWKTAAKEETPVSNKPDHPVASIHWKDADGFCQWLSKKEGRTYRLPKDREWSIAIGLGGLEMDKASSTPEQLNGAIEEFPWDGSYPLKAKDKDKAGNYADATFKAKFPKDAAQEDYTDGFAITAPVMSFKPNKLGIYDLGGGVWEWCDDQYSATITDRILRGASWASSSRGHLLSSCRIRNPNRRYDYGFRIVLVEEKKP